MMIVADKEVSLVLTGTGDVLEPEAGIVGIGSGGNYALAAARALADGPLDAEAIVRRSLDIAADICVYTNRNVTVETLKHAVSRTDFLSPAKSSPSSTASSSARATPSAPWRSRCATAGAGCNSTIGCARKCCRRIS